MKKPYFITKNNKLKLILGYLLFNAFLFTYAQNNNVAFGKPTLADSVLDSRYVSSNAVDGDNENALGRWLSANTSYPHWVEVDLQGSYEIEQLKFWTGVGGGNYSNVIQYEFQIWNGSSWVTVVDGSSNTDAVVDERFARVTTSRVRLFGLGAAADNIMRLYELQVFEAVKSGGSLWDATGNDINYVGGNVGIGTTAPAAKLNIVNSSTIGFSDISKASLLLGSTTFGIGLDSNEIAGKGTDVYLGTTDDNDIQFFTEGKTKMFIQGPTGNVGIGTTAPAAKLNIVNSSSIGFSDISKASLLVGSVTNGLGIDRNEVAVSGNDIYLGTTDDNDVQFFTDGITKMFIQGPTGNVGIGTSSPKNKLSVNGTIWAREVKVSLTDAADWVFENDYKLRSLSEVEKFIKENKHLPEVPSAEEFRKNDMKVSEMTNKLLQKIEELTLYTIAQEKEINEQQTAIETQQKVNEELKFRLAKLEALLIK